MLFRVSQACLVLHCRTAVLQTQSVKRISTHPGLASTTDFLLLSVQVHTQFLLSVQGSGGTPGEQVLSITKNCSELFCFCFLNAVN